MQRRFNVIAVAIGMLLCGSSFIFATSTDWVCSNTETEIVNVYSNYVIFQTDGPGTPFIAFYIDGTPNADYWFKMITGLSDNRVCYKWTDDWTGTPGVITHHGVNCYRLIAVSYRRTQPLRDPRIGDPN